MNALEARSSPRALLLCLLWACAPAGRSPPVAADSRVVPVEQEPHHRPIFQNGLVRVLDVRIPPGDTTGYHVHAHRLIGVALLDARTWTQWLGAQPDSVAMPGAVPYVFDNWARALPYTHRLSNVDSTPIHYIVAERLASWKMDTPALPDTLTRQLVREGELGRVYQITLGPNGATERHTHAAPGLTVLATPGTIDEDGSAPAAGGGTGAGRWTWRNAGHQHLLRNEGPAAVTLYELDWR